MEQNERFRYLFSRYAEKNYSAAEKEELFGMISTSEYDGILEELVGERWKMTIPEWARENDDEKADAIFQAVLERVKVRKLFTFKRIAVAASILLAVGLGSYFILFNKKDKPAEIVKTTVPGDVKAPETNRAMITLANGQKVYLDSADNGTLATQGNVNLSKTADGKIAYSGTSSEVVYNTLTNPRGSKVIDMQLADGSHVWLNAGSSVTYPVAFVGNERKVSITGEAYFEVAHDLTKPFYVSKGNMSVQVLGTHFNVNAYDDESDIKITLLEGSVKVSKDAINKLIKPGQQAVLTHNSELITLNSPDLEQVMAWKNGRFELNGSTIEPIMREVARWYNVEIFYEGPKPQANFMGGTSRKANVSELLKILEQTGAVRFRIDERKIVVASP